MPPLYPASATHPPTRRASRYAPGVTISDRADIVVRNARVYTVDAALPWAEAVAVRGGSIVAVGSDDDVTSLIGHGTEVIDAGGRLILPGIIDSHNHVRLGSNELVGVASLFDATTLEEVRARISARAASLPEDAWVEAEGFNYTASGGRMPTVEDLAGVTGGRPAFVTTYDAHNAWLNREGLARFGITRDTERVPFGTVVKDHATGEPTGIVGDFGVMGLERRGVAALAEHLPSYAPEAQYQGLVANMDMALEFGITTVVEPQNSLDDLALFERARAEGRLRSRLIAALFHPVGTTDAELREFQEAARLFDDDRLRVGPIKLYIDDVIEPHTAAVLEPYATEPRTLGNSFYEAAEFRELITKLDRMGFQTFTHGTGDRGIRMVLDAHEAALKAMGGAPQARDVRHQIVHAECIDPADIPRFGALGVVACMQPRHFAPDIVGAWRDAIGPDRERRAAPWRSLDEAGATLAFSSDWNVAEVDPLVGIYTALTRANLKGDDAWGTDQTVDLTTAIRAYTMGGAFANHVDDRRGSITVGKQADLIVLSRDLFDPAQTPDPLDILDTRVELVMVDGEVPIRQI